VVTSNFFTNYSVNDPSKIPHTLRETQKQIKSLIELNKIQDTSIIEKKKEPSAISLVFQKKVAKSLFRLALSSIIFYGGFLLFLLSNNFYGSLSASGIAVAIYWVAISISDLRAYTKTKEKNQQKRYERYVMYVFKAFKALVLGIVLFIMLQVYRDNNFSIVGPNYIYLLLIIHVVTSAYLVYLVAFRGFFSSVLLSIVSSIFICLQCLSLTFNISTATRETYLDSFWLQTGFIYFFGAIGGSALIYGIYKLVSYKKDEDWRIKAKMCFYLILHITLPLYEAFEINLNLKRSDIYNYKFSISLSGLDQFVQHWDIVIGCLIMVITLIGTFASEKKIKKVLVEFWRVFIEEPKFNSEKAKSKSTRYSESNTDFNRSSNGRESHFIFQEIPYFMKSKSPSLYIEPSEEELQQNIDLLIARFYPQASESNKKYDNVNNQISLPSSQSIEDNSYLNVRRSELKSVASSIQNEKAQINDIRDSASRFKFFSQLKPESRTRPNYSMAKQNFLSGDSPKKNNKSRKSSYNASESFQGINYCTLCFDNIADAIIMKCGHSGICIKCALDLWKDKKSCFICRGVKLLITTSHLR